MKSARSTIFIDFISNQCKKWVLITRIWNRVMNFGTESKYLVPATNH